MFTRKGYATSVSGKTANGCPVRSAKPPDNMNFHYISPSADDETLRGFNTQKGKAYRLPFLFCYCRIKQRKFLQDAQPVLVEGLPGCLKIGRKRFAVNLLPIRQRPVALALPVGMLARNLVKGYKRHLCVTDHARRFAAAKKNHTVFSDLRQRLFLQFKRKQCACRRRFCSGKHQLRKLVADRAATAKRPCAIRRLFRHAAAFTIRMPHLFCCHCLLLMCSEAAPRRCRAVRLFPPAPACSASRFQKACLRSRP